MFPLWVAVVFGAIVMSITATETPIRQAQLSQLTADVEATNFLAYRRAVQKYLEAYPNASGTISDASLAPYWLTGYVRDAKWSNRVAGAGGNLFVYAASQPAHAMPDMLRAKTDKNLLVGRKDAATGRLVSLDGLDTGITVPTIIPDNAVVMMGR